VRKKTRLTAAFISALLFSAVAGTIVVNLGEANPYLYETISPPRDALPPAITMFSPRNNTVFNTSDVFFNCLVEVGNSNVSYWVYGLWVTYKVDWQNDTMEFPILDEDDHSWTRVYFALEDVPDGNHSIIVEAFEGGHIVKQAGRSTIGLVQEFSMTSYSVVNFTVDTNAPTINFFSSRDKTCATRNFPLNFSVNEPVSQITYSLDGQGNVTIAGNMTLTNLPFGEHNVTIYATDNVGNTGTSETVCFTVNEPEPFPTALVLTASATSVTIIGITLIIYFKKCKH
jgi:hypothetical protein